MSVRRFVGVLLVGVVVVGALAYAGASWMLFDVVSRVDARCGYFDDGSPRFGEYTPASFATAGVSTDFTADGFDTAPYLMSDYEELRIESRDGVDLAAWWVPGATLDAPAVVIVHGKGSCRHDPVVLLPAGMLHRNGFAVLMVDTRDMGDSEVIDGRFTGGIEEHLDALGAWDWLRERGLPASRIGLLGGSNGAATVLIAAGEEPLVEATWEDSGYADLTVAIDEEVRLAGYPDILTPGGKLWARIFGIDLDAFAPADAVRAIGTRRLQLVHGISDDRVHPHHVIDLARVREEATERAGPDLEPWLVPLAEHVEAAFAVPEEYERRLVAFFGDALGMPAEAAAP